MEELVKSKKLTTSALSLSLVFAIAIPAFSSTASSAAIKPAAAVTAADVGGINALAAACKKEGQLNIIADPHDWANYGEIITGFKTKYKVKIDEANPNGSSQDEINAAVQLKGTKRAPDVFDLGQSVAYANLDMLAPYKVINWDKIPAALKAPNGTLTKDYGGYMAVGYDASLGSVSSLDDLLKPAFAGKVALNGDPTKANAALHGVLLAALLNGGSTKDISAGVTWFKKLKDAGNFINVDPSPATIASGQTPVVFDWDYNQAAVVKAMAAKGVTWKVWIPANQIVGSYYNQAVNADAPHPACARLWMEYVYSPAGQSAWLKGGSRPVLMDYYLSKGLIDKKLAASLPVVKGTINVFSIAQSKAASDYLAANWAAAVGTR